MQRKDKWRLAASIVPPVVLLAAATLAACRDSLSAGKSVPPVTLSPPIQFTDSQLRVRAAIHERNPMEWIGKAHNQGLHSFRAELRKPGRVAPRLCSFLADFATSPDKVPVLKGHSRPERATHRQLIERHLCATATAALNASPTYVPAAMSLEATPSAQVVALTSQVTEAINSAANSYDLSVRLTPILDAALALDTVSRAALATAISVAQNSFEYWESELWRFHEEVQSEYRECIEATMQSTYPIDQGSDNCLNGGAQVIRSPNVDDGLRPRFILARISPNAPACGANQAWESIKRTASSDADGANYGFWGGLAVTKTLFGAGGAATGGAIAKSGYTATKETWTIIKCAYTPPDKRP